MPKSDTIQLKNRNDVYYEMYKEARKKAKIAKDAALTAYLEAKRIKNTYMLTNLSDSDSDSDSDSNNDSDNDNDNDSDNINNINLEE